MGGADAARIRWRCRRGLKELDVLMERFVVEHLPHLSPTQLSTMSRLLDAGDPDLMDWILGRRSPADAGFEPMLTLLRGLVPPDSPGES